MYMLIENEIHRYVKVYSVSVLEGCQVRFLAKIPDVVGLSSFRLFERQMSMPKLMKRQTTKDGDLQVKILLKAIRRLPECAVLVDHSCYYVCLAGSPIYRSAILLNNKAVQIRNVKFTSEGHFEVEASGVKFEHLTTKRISDPLACLFLTVLR